MPIYEYEPVGRQCLMCEGRIEILQSASEDALALCPWCGLEVKRVISRAEISMRSAKTDFDKAAKRGFTTFRRSESGVWERIAGDGADVIKREDSGAP